MKKVITILLAVTAAMFMTACGGGGGGSVSEPNTNQYDLRTFIDTASYTINGEGTITISGETYSGTGVYQSTYQGTGTAPTGETINNHETIMLGSANGIDLSLLRNHATYMGYIAFVEYPNDGISCETPLSSSDVTPIPTDAQVGYISDIVPLECNNGAYITNVFKLSDAGGGNAELSLISNTYEYQGGALMVSETMNIVVTPGMSIVSAEISRNDSWNDLSLLVYSTSITQN